MEWPVQPVSDNPRITKAEASVTRCEGQSAYKSNLGIRFLKYTSLSFEPPRGTPAAAMQKWYDYIIQRAINLSVPRVTHA